MANRVLTEGRPMAKKTKPKPEFERIEFQAPPGFQARIDRASERRGLSRSAYIRQAVLLLMNDDEKNLRLPTEERQ